MEKKPIKIKPKHIKEILAREKELFVKKHPKSQDLFKRANNSLLGGVPMSWMRIWEGGFPIFIEKAKGNFLKDVDGIEYIDFCLGDTGALFGHAPEIITNTLIQQMNKGITHMLPTEDVIHVGEELSRRFKLPYWQILMTATDANRMALKVAREITGKRKILAFNMCYHGSVDETLCVDFFGKMMHIPGMIGPIVEDPSQTTRIVEFNDIDGLEKALANNDVACVITEPVMTNVGIIYPELGFHKKLRELTRKYHTFLLIDETHSICGGFRGMTGEMNLDPDILVLGKAIAGGFPAAVLGFTKEIASQLEKRVPWHLFFGFGGTLSGNAAAIACIRATLENLMTKENYDYMIPLAEKMEKGLIEIFQENNLQWYVKRIGCRVEFRFLPNPPKNGTETLQDVPYNMVDPFTEGLTGPLEALIHVYAANRGIILTPVHDMALIAPTTTHGEISKYLEVIRELVKEIIQ